MPSCRYALSVLVLMTVTLCTDAPVVKVEFNGTAVLPCSERCSGVVRWSMFSKSSDTLAECDQTSCRSVKEGYQIIYNQYLQGDLSLIIPEADFSKRGTYTCDCDGRDLCDVVLQIEPLKTTVHKKVGETLVLEIKVLDQVEVIYSSTDPAGTSNLQICRVERRSVEFRSDYSERASLTSDLELRGMEESDSGVYTVRNTLTKEIIHIYTVMVHGDSEAQKKEQNSGQEAALPGWVVPVLVVLGIVCVVSLMGNGVLCSKINCVQKKSASRGAPYLYSI